MKHLALLLTILIGSSAIAQPTISFTFDDGITSDRPGYSFEEWNQMLLDNLAEADITSIFFVKGDNKLDEKGQFLMQSWNEKGHKIANHTYTHPNFNKENNTADDFEKELLQTDSIISGYENYVRLFRFPYLKEGGTPEKVASIREVMKKHEYKNGHVSIDASDWYIDSRLRNRLKENPKADIEGFKAFYLEHLFERASYYESLAFDLTGRHIRHVMLLHHNLAAALFLDDLIELFKSKGWNVISADKAYEDPIYNKVTRHGGESLIWVLAKDTGTYELRYPAEDGTYEMDRMDELGL